MQAVPLVSWQYIAHFRLNAIDYPGVEGNNSRLIMEVKRNLSRAIDEGEVKSLLGQLAERAGYVNYSTVETGVYSFTAFEVAEGEESDRDSDRLLSDGGIAGVVIAGVMVVAVAVLVWYYFCFWSRKQVIAGLENPHNEGHPGTYTVVKVSEAEVHL